jgi:integrase
VDNYRYNDKFAENKLAKISITNQPAARAYIHAKRAQGLKPPSIALIAVALQALDQYTGGKPYLELNQEDLTEVVRRHATTHAPSSVRLLTVQLRGFFRWSNDDELPKFVRRAFKRLPTEKRPNIEPLTKDEFEAMLNVARNVLPRRRSVFLQALLWTL